MNRIEGLLAAMDSSSFPMRTASDSARICGISIVGNMRSLISVSFSNQNADRWCSLGGEK